MIILLDENNSKTISITAWIEEKLRCMCKQVSCGEKFNATNRIKIVLFYRNNFTVASIFQTVDSRLCDWKWFFLLVEKNVCLGETRKSHEHCEFVTILRCLMQFEICKWAEILMWNKIFWGYVDEKLNGFLFKFIDFPWLLFLAF